MAKATPQRPWARAVSGAAMLALGACASASADGSGSDTSASADAGGAQMAAQPAPDRITKQEANRVTYWVMPGPRELSPAVFGTPDDPRMTLAPKVKAAEQAVAAGKMPPSVPGLLRDLPILVGVPEKARSTTADGGMVLEHPTPFSDAGRIIQGEFEAQFWDNIDHDPPGKPGKTPDKAEMTATFTDPEGNDYRVVLDHVVKPPFPGYETDGGVLLNGYHHGSTGTGTPLMPQVWTIGAFWGVGEVHVNGELRSKKRVMHLMTTETVRDNDYNLATNEEMPLRPEQWLVKGQAHHTHLIVLPIQATKKGPVFKPLETAFTLPNGKPQPFMHIMFEQDTVVK